MEEKTKETLPITWLKILLETDIATHGGILVSFLGLMQSTGMIDREDARKSLRDLFNDIDPEIALRILKQYKLIKFYGNFVKITDEGKKLIGVTPELSKPKKITKIKPSVPKETGEVTKEYSVINEERPKGKIKGTVVSTTSWDSTEVKNFLKDRYRGTPISNISLKSIDKQKVEFTVYIRKKGRFNTSVKITEYMKSRQYNRKLYGRLVEKLEEIANNIEEAMPWYEGLKIEISMSAKYQTPYISIETEEKNYDNIGDLEAEIRNALDEIGFTAEDTEEKQGKYFINFSDNPPPDY